MERQRNVAGSQPAGVNGIGQFERKARPRYRSIPAAESAYAVPGKGPFANLKNHSPVRGS